MRSVLTHTNDKPTQALPSYDKRPRGNTGYTRPMAKVMVSIPDDLLARIDARVEAEHATRSGFLQRLAEHELAARGRQQQQRIEELLGEPVRLGGDSAKLIREDRESR